VGNGHPAEHDGRTRVSLPSDLLTLLACPECRGSLAEDGLTLICAHCASRYPVTNGIPQLLPAVLAAGAPTDPAWKAWAGALDRLLAWRRRTWDGGVRAQTFQRAVSEIQAEFIRHCRLDEVQGSVLDVGCGSGEIAAALPVGCRYVGVDPLPLPGTSGLQMIRGVGERLPFRVAAFDLVLVLETLDHCQSPNALMAEILRVLKPEGRLCVEQYVTAPRWRERFPRLLRRYTAPGRPAPADSAKVILLDAPDVRVLLESAFAEVRAGRASQGSHVFLAARWRRDASGGS